MKEIHLKHKVEQWKLRASMKNMKEEFGTQRKKNNLESLETKY